MIDPISTKMHKQLSGIGVDSGDIGKFAPRCTRCAGPIPQARATVRTRYTCSPECALVLKAAALLRRASRKCPLCLHPFTPKEREEFREWRRHRGDLGVNPVGKPPVKRVRLLEAALREAVETMEASPSMGTAWWEDKISQFKNLLDAKRPNGSTLAASGQPTEVNRGEDHAAIG